jgi:hypothetical protein
VSFAPNINSPRYYRLYGQVQTSAYNVVNNSSGTWTNTAAQLIRIDEGSFNWTRSAPYSRFPVLTGTRSEVAGIRGRKNGPSWSIRGMPIIPSGTAGTPPDMDMIFGNIFGALGTVSMSPASVTYGPFVDTGVLPLSLFYFNHPNPSTMTSLYLWGAFVRQWTINFNGNFLTIDLDGFFGWGGTSTSFSTVVTQGGNAGLTSFPTEPSSPTVNGQPIAGFGQGYTLTVASQTGLELKTRVLSITGETGWVPIQDVFGSPFPIAAVGDSRRMAIQFSALDDDSTSLDNLKTDSEADNTSYTGTIVAGAAAGSTMTTTLSNIQLTTWGFSDQGAVVNFDLPTSYGHASAPGQTNDMQIVFT